MKKGMLLVSVLYRFSKISFYFLIIFFTIAIVFEIFTEDGKLGKFSSGVHHSIGYQVPVSLKVQPESPMFNNLFFKLKSEGMNTMGQQYPSRTSNYVKPLLKEDSLNFKTIVSIHNRGMEDEYQLTSDIYRGDGHVKVKPQRLLDKILLLLKTYINFILLIIIFFFLKKIFKALKTKFEFSQKLYKSIRVIGLILISRVFLVTICNFILGNQLSYVDIKPLDYKLQYVTISMNPRLDFDFTLLLIGFSLIVLSSLLKAGNRIQQENELTI